MRPALLRLPHGDGHARLAEYIPHLHNHRHGITAGSFGEEGSQQFASPHSLGYGLRREARDFRASVRDS